MPYPLVVQLREAMTSEHCSYKSTKHFLRELPMRARHVIQGPGENAGIVDIGKGWAIALRIESHNHPSYLDPYQGAATGVGGILRDIFTMGARPIALLDFLRFGVDKKAGTLQKGVVRGIADYGNCIGVPTVGGDIFFDATYNHNCLVNVCAIGLIKKEHIVYGNAMRAGSDLIYVGARTGRDGVGGATMASAALEGAQASAVQKGDPFLEKLLLEACGELSQTLWIEGMQDMGAAGLLCSTTEVIARGRNKTGRNLGAKIFLDRVPRKASRMTPREILLSESQERMLIVGKREHRRDILNIFHKWDLEATCIGTVTNDGLYMLLYKEGRRGKRIQAPFEEVLPGDLRQDWPQAPQARERSAHREGTLAEKQTIWHQYDWMVGTRTRKGPNGKGNWSALDIPECGKELIVSWGSDEGKSSKSPTRGMEYAFMKCLKTMRRQKAKPLALTNCLNFGHPQVAMGAFANSVKTLSTLCRKFDVPVISGNVSLYNAQGTHSIKPTPILVMIGIRN